MSKWVGFYIDDEYLKYWKETKDKTALMNQLLKQHFNPDKLELEERLQLLDYEIEEMNKRKSQLKNMIRVKNKQEEELLKKLMPELKKNMRHPPQPSDIPNYFLKNHGIIRTMEWVAKHWEEY